jgi:hypothetical protein
MREHPVPSAPSSNLDPWNRQLAEQTREALTRHPQGVYLGTDLLRPHRENLPEEDAMLRAFRHLLDALEEVQAVHQGDAEEACDCLLCQDIEHAIWQVEMFAGLIGNSLMPPPEEVEALRRQFPVSEVETPLVISGAR